MQRAIFELEGEKADHILTQQSLDASRAKVKELEKALAAKEKELAELKTQYEKDVRVQTMMELRAKIAKVRAEVWREAAKTVLAWTYFPEEGSNSENVRKRFAEHFEAKAKAAEEGR